LPLVRYYLERVPHSEADTRAKLIAPELHQCGWSEDMICREPSLGAVVIIDGKARRRSSGRSDCSSGFA
jgi:type I restriction enzyme, R subunit